MKQVYKLPPCADALRLVLEPQPEGGYTTTCPVIPNLVTEADTLEDVPANAADALAALIELCRDLGNPLPPARQPLAAAPDTPIWTETLIAAEIVCGIASSPASCTSQVARRLRAPDAGHTASGTIQPQVVTPPCQTGAGLG